MKYRFSPAFALPTILLSSVVMLIVLLLAIQSTISVSEGIRGQYVEKLGSTAAESGVAMAKACIAQNGTITWTNAKPLKPNTTCTGDETLGFTCPISVTDPRCYVLEDSVYRSTFRVGVVYDSGNNPTDIDAEGLVREVRATSGTVIRENTMSTKVKLGGIGISGTSGGVSLASGFNHSCALDSGGKAYCWGYNATGQVGDGTTSNTNAPVAVSQGAIPGGVTLTSITTGSGHSCALASDNKAYCWGYNGDGQLGNNSITASSVPVAVSQGAIPSGVTLKSIAVGGYHACAIGSDNKAYCWGNGSNGTLGNGTTADSSVPVAVSQGAIPTGATINIVTTGASHTCAIASDNKAYCWGNGSSGKMGNGTTTSTNSTPVAVSQGAIPAGVTLKSISIGSTHTCVLGSDGSGYCWGQNTYGQLGNNSTTQSTTPVAVSQGAIPAGVTLKSIAAGGSHTCAVGSDSKAYCWGQNVYGQLGRGSSGSSLTPVAVYVSSPLPSGAPLALSAGDSHTCAIGSDSKAYCWGVGSLGRLGNGASANSNIPVAVSQGAIPAGVTLKSITAGGSHTCAIGSDNKGYCWGYNLTGQLGNNSTTPSTVPVAVSQGAIPAGVTIKSITTGASHTCAVGSDNKGYCWGDNSNGRLGNNSTTQSNIPVAVSQGAIPAGVTLKSITAGGSHTCAIGSDDKGYCWGNGGNGRLGNGGVADPLTPVAVSQGAIPAGVTLKSMVAGSLGHTCAIGADNKAYCWGDNGSGQLGNNTTSSSLVPVAVAHGTVGSIPASVTLKNITAGNSHTCAVDSDNKAYCWGAGSSGQIGANTTFSYYAPASVVKGEIPNGVTFSSVTAGAVHTCAVVSSGSLFCWGNGGSGRLGNNATNSSSVPVSVLQATIWGVGGGSSSTPLTFYTY